MLADRINHRNFYTKVFKNISSTSETIIETDVDLNLIKKIEMSSEKDFDIFGKIVVDSNDVIDEFVSSPNAVEDELMITSKLIDRNFLVELRVIIVKLKSRVVIVVKINLLDMFVK